MGHDNGLDTFRKQAIAKGTQIDLGSALQRTLENCRCECTGVMGMKRLGAMPEDGDSLLEYNCNRFSCDVTLDAWKWR